MIWNNLVVESENNSSLIMLNTVQCKLSDTGNKNIYDHVNIKQYIVTSFFSMNT